MHVFGFIIDFSLGGAEETQMKLSFSGAFVVFCLTFALALEESGFFFFFFLGASCVLCISEGLALVGSLAL